MNYHIEKSITINKDLATVKSLVEDFKQWNSWSPWTVLDPQVKNEYQGSAGDKGHMMSWDGEIIGSGSMHIVKNEQNQIDYALEFIKPFKSKATSTFILKENNGQTEVIWTMDSGVPFFMFFMLPMLKMMVGMDYVRGLKMLKSVAETGTVPATTQNKGIRDYEGFSYIGIQRTATMDEMGDAMKADFEKILNDFIYKGTSAKHWVTLYPKVHASTNSMTYIAAISDEEIDKNNLPAGYVTGEIASGKVLEITHDGPYDFLGNAWNMGMMTARAKQMKQKGSPFEQYWNSPLETEPNDLKTSIFLPLK